MRREAVRKTIKRLVKEGLLAFGPSHLVYPITSSSGPLPLRGEGWGGGRSGTAADHSPDPSPSRGGSEANQASKRDPEHVVGTFRRAEAGFGFVRPEGTLAQRGPRRRHLHSRQVHAATPPTATR